MLHFYGNNEQMFIVDRYIYANNNYTGKVLLPLYGNSGYGYATYPYCLSCFGYWDLEIEFLNVVCVSFAL